MLVAQRAAVGNAAKEFVAADATVVALTGVRVIDGTGTGAREDQTIIIRDGLIAELGDRARIKPAADATVIDLAGHSVIPGLVMVHEHLYYPTGPGVYGQLGASFVRLYLAGGETKMRTAGNIAVGKQADLVVIDGNPLPRPSPTSGRSRACSSRVSATTPRS
jgi:imidazolonepropionase-like amidohydrolase